MTKTMIDYDTLYERLLQQLHDVDMECKKTKGLGWFFASGQKTALLDALNIACELAYVGHTKEESSI